MMNAPSTQMSPFHSVVFAGGGSRCTWQIGFWQVVAPALGLRPRQIAAVSAGAAMATVLLADRVEQALEAFSTRMSQNAKNFYPSHLFQRGKAAFPQAAIYREAMLATIDQDALARLHQAPPIYILLARPPRWLGARSGALMGFVSYKLEKKFRHPLHPQWGQRLGFQAEVVSSHDCQTPEDLVDLILQSSCTPPFTPLFRRNGSVVLDGGLVDNVPCIALPDESPEEGKTLVLLSRPYPAGKLIGPTHRIYVQPSQPAAVSTWEYTSPKGLLATYEIGKRDGETFLRQWEQWETAQQAV